MDKNTVIKELNAFLEGNYMAVHGYERYIQHVKDPYIKDELQKIQQDHKHHIIQVAERIQDIGGTPIEGVGLMGKMAQTMNGLKGTSEATGFILKDARKAEDQGIQMAEEIVKGDLDPESKRLVQSILDVDRQHVQLLNRLVH